MADITMCVNNKCPIRRLCYRATAKPTSKHQSIASFQFKKVDKTTVECDHFWNDSDREVME